MNSSVFSLVGSETGAVVRRQLLVRIRSFPLRAQVEAAVTPVSSPRRIARSMRICRTTRSCTGSRQGLWGRAGWTDCFAWLVGDSVVIEQAEVAIHPRSAPPFPSEAVTLARPRQVVPNLVAVENPVLIAAVDDVGLRR